MRNVLEMFNQICDVLYYAGIDPQDLLDQETDAVDLAKSIRVLGAEQPNWPLAKTVHGFVLLPDDNIQESEEDDKESLVCWITFNGNHPYDRSPYAPRDCWNS